MKIRPVFVAILASLAVLSAHTHLNANPPNGYPPKIIYVDPDPTTISDVTGKIALALLAPGQELTRKQRAGLQFEIRVAGGPNALVTPDGPRFDFKAQSLRLRGGEQISIFVRTKDGLHQWWSIFTVDGRHIRADGSYDLNAAEARELIVIRAR